MKSNASLNRVEGTHTSGQSSITPAEGISLQGLTEKLQGRRSLEEGREREGGSVAEEESEMKKEKEKIKEEKVQDEERSETTSLSPPPPFSTGVIVESALASRCQPEQSSTQNDYNSQHSTNNSQHWKQQRQQQRHSLRDSSRRRAMHSSFSSGECTPGFSSGHSDSTPLHSPRSPTTTTTTTLTSWSDRKGHLHVGETEVSKVHEEDTPPFQAKGETPMVKECQSARSSCSSTTAGTLSSGASAAASPRHQTERHRHSAQNNEVCTSASARAASNAWQRSHFFDSFAESIERYATSQGQQQSSSETATKPSGPRNSASNNAPKSYAYNAALASAGNTPARRQLETTQQQKEKQRGHQTIVSPASASTSASTATPRSVSSWRSQKSTLRNGTANKKQNQKQVQYQETSAFDTPSSSSSFSTSSSSQGQGEVSRKLSTQRRNSSDLHSTSSGWSAPFGTGAGRTLSFSPPPAPKFGPRKKGLQRVASAKILSRSSKLSLASPSPSLNIRQSSIGDRDSSRPTSIPEEELVSQYPDDTNDMNPPEAATNGQHDGAYSSKPISGAATEAATSTSTSTNIAAGTVATRRKSGIASLASWRPSTIFKRFGKSKKQNRDGKKQQKNHQASQERLRDDDHTESRSVKEAVSQRQKNPTTHASALFSGSSSSSSMSSSQNPTPMNHHNAHRTAAARLVTGHIVRREPETERKVVAGSIRTHHRQHRFPRRHTAGEMESSRESESYTQTEVHAEATTNEASTVLLTEAERKAIEQKRAETLAVLAARAGSETVAKLILAVSDKAENMVKEAEERAYSSSSAVNRATRLPNMLNRLVRRSSSSSSSSRQSRRSRGESGSSSITDFDPRQNPVNFQISPAEARKAFDGSSEPKIGLDRYLCRLVRYLDAYHEQQPGENSVGIRCLLIAMMYIERLCNTVPQFALTRLNVHRLFMVGTLVAAKMEEDDHCSNDYWSGVGGVEVVEINHLEGSFCKYMKFDLVVFPTELAAFYQVYGRGILPSNFVLGTPDTCDREGSR